MARRYTVTTKNIACTAAQDLQQIIGATGKMLRIIGHIIGCTDVTPPANQQIQVEGMYLPATVTNGSGGTSPTPQPIDPGDAAASFTAKANNTTPATTNGTASPKYENGFNIFAGDVFMHPNPPVIGPSESYVLGMLSTPNGTLHLSVTQIVEEIGG